MERKDSRKSKSLSTIWFVCFYGCLFSFFTLLEVWNFCLEIAFFFTFFSFCVKKKKGKEEKGRERESIIVVVKVLGCRSSAIHTFTHFFFSFFSSCGD